MLGYGLLFCLLAFCLVSVYKKGTREMKNFDIEVFVKDLDKLFNDMQDKAIAGSENVATASWVIKNQTKEIEYWKEMFEKAMKEQER